MIAALAFNVLTVVACLIEAAQGRAEGHPSLFGVLPLRLLFALVILTAGCVVALIRRGR